jgi:hypothetical protein
MAIHLNIAGTHGRSQEQQAEVREAKRILKERIRCDWEYGPLPQHRSSGIRPPVVDDSRPTTTTAASLVQDVREPIAGFRFHSTTTSVGGGGGGDGGPSSQHPPGGVLGLTFDPTEWRDREYSSMSESSDEEEEVTAETVILESFRLSQRMELGRPSGSKAGGSKGKPFRFDGPDSVGAEVAARRQATKRRRQTRLAEESGWNDGLAHWLRRRDEWCGARDADAVLALQKRKAAADADPDRPATSASTSLADAESEGSTPRTSVSSSPNTPGSPSATTPEPSLSDVPPTTVAPKGSSTTATTTTTVTPTVSTGTSIPENAAVPAIPTSSQPPPPPNPQPSSSSSSPPPPTPISSHPSSSLLLPLAPPLLPASHPIRARITPQSYPEIYSKIILQARTPSVPINLRTLLAALVAGWKADDEWPPKPSAGLAAEKSLGRKKTAAAASNARPAARRRDVGGEREPEGLRHGVKAAVGRVLRLGGALSSSHSSSGGGVGGDAAAKNTSRRKEEGG